MGLKVFISYSHVDDGFRAEFEKYLIQLKREDILDVWTDQEIKLWDEWEKELLGRLTESEIVVFLVSQDFISSKYCYEVEMETAIELHRDKKAVVAPILVRECDWKNTSVSEFQVCPTSAVPLASWENHDKAWMDVLNHMRRLISDYLETKKMTDKEHLKLEEHTQDTDTVLNDSFSTWLEDTEITLTNSLVDRVGLSDVYTTPHLSDLTKELEAPSKTIDSSVLHDFEESALILGDEQSGKTSLCKHLILECLNKNILPCFANLRDIKNADPIALLESKNLAKVYQSLDSEKFLQQEKKILIIDDLDSAGLNSKYKNLFIKRSLELFDICLFFAHESFQFVANELEVFEDIKYYEILPFGHQKRTALIEKWVSIGRQENISDETLYSNVDELKLQIDSFVRGNIVPAKPLYIMTVLQMRESFAHKEPEQTTSGYCYEYLIMKALEKAGVRAGELDSYQNILTEFAWYIYENKPQSGQDNFNVFFKDYENRFLSNVKAGDVKKVLLNSRLIRIDASEVSFRYPYIFYFFVAKRIASKMSEVGEIRSEVSRLIDTLHREDSSNIIVFLSHHSRNPWVLEEIQLRLMQSFEEIDEATLEKEATDFLAEFVKNIPDLIMEKKDVSEERLDLDQQRDEAESSYAKIDKYLESDHIFVEINRVIRGVEIVGQILRNRHGSIEQATLLQMVTIATEAGLRFLQFFLEITDSSKSEVIRFIEQQLNDHPELKIEEIRKEAESTFQYATYSAMSAILRKISSSIGSKEAKAIYAQLEAIKPTPAVKLINQSIELQFHKKLDPARLGKLAASFRSNPICERMLQEIVLQHAYMYPLSYKEKQQISDKLGISIEGQIRLEQARKRSGD